MDGRFDEYTERGVQLLKPQISRVYNTENAADLLTSLTLYISEGLEMDIELCKQLQCTRPSLLKCLAVTLRA